MSSDVYFLYMYRPLNNMGLNCHGLTYMWMFFNEYIGTFFGDLEQCGKDFSSFIYSKNTAYNKDSMQSKC